MYSELDLYIERLDGLVKKLSPPQRRGLMKEVAGKLRRSNKQRIRANIETSGRAMIARKAAAVQPLRKNARIRAGDVFQYRGRLVRMRTIKTAASAANPSRDTTQPYDSEYVWGYDAEWGGIKKYKKSEIGKPASGVRGKLMFRKIHQYKYLKQKADANGAAVGFMSGLSGYIAAAHQYGEPPRPPRELLGFSADDLREIEQAVVAHIAAAGV